MVTIGQLAVEDFSLARSGRLNKLLEWVGLVDSSIKGYTKRSLAIIGVTWVPLLILCIFQDLAWGNRVDMTFLKDFATHLKFLLVIPMLIFAEYFVDHRLKELTEQFFKSGTLGEKELSVYDRLKKRIKKLSDSIIADWLILFVIISNIAVRWLKNVHQASTWLVYPDTQGGSISWAGFWAIYFCVPIIQYLLFRWLWRWIVCSIYFSKISKMPLKLSPAHPDKSGGIGFLGIPPAPFLLVTLAMAISISAMIAEKIFWVHDRLPTYYPVIIGFAILSIVINVLPLIVFMSPMSHQRRQGILDYSTLIKRHHELFDEKWIGKTDLSEFLGSPDASTTTDLNSTFDTVMGMQIFPFNLKTMLYSIAIAVLPMLPLLAFEYNWLDLLKKILGMLI